MRQFVFVVSLVLTFLDVKSQPNVVFIKEMKWSFSLPPTMKIDDSVQYKEAVDHQRKIYLKAANDSAKAIEYINNLKNLLIAKDAQASTFTITCVDIKYDPFKGEFNEKQFAGNPKLKAKQSTVVYGGVNFKRLEVEITPAPNVTYRSLLLKNTYKDKVFTVICSFLNQSIESQILDMLAKSTFSR